MSQNRMSRISLVFSFFLSLGLILPTHWGWWTQWAGDQILNDGWYTLTADWEVEKDGETYTYNHNVKMLYDFSIAN